MSTMPNFMDAQVFQNINILPWIIFLLFINMLVSGFFIYTLIGVPYWLSSRIKVLKLTIANIRNKNRPVDEATIYKTIDTAGYSYDAKQDIFYSNMNPWQRKVGFCKLYDEAAAAMSMIIDCEPVEFTYDGKKWLIELWKGQYCLNSGGEVGVYNTYEPEIDISELFTGNFYQSVSNEDRLYMSYTLLKNGRVLFEREGVHWWLTGFKLGEFSEPDQLTMEVNITLKDYKMLRAFVNALKALDYTDSDLYIRGTTVSLIFDKPHSPQPYTRTRETDWMVQRYNEHLCKKYQEITGPYVTFPEKVNAIKDQAPEIYNALFLIGKTRPLYKVFKKIKKHLK